MSREKSFYHIYAEYLKRSAAYKKYCEDFAAQLEKKEVKHPPKSEKEKDLSCHYLQLACRKNYKIFVNIFRDGIQYEKRFKGISRFSAYTIDCYSSHVEKDIDEVFKQHEKEGEETGLYPAPDVEEFKSDLLEVVHAKEHTFCVSVNKTFLMVDSKALEQLTKELAEFIENEIQLFDYRVRLDEWKRYLRVYDLHKKRWKWKDIVNIIDPGKDFSENVRRAFHLDYAKAQRLISNAEMANFPGKYGPLKSTA